MTLKMFILQNRYLKLTASVSVFILLASCATGPGFKEHSEQLSPVPNEKARLYLYRPTGKGSSIKPDIRLDGNIVGQSLVKEFIVLDVDSGVHKLSTSTDSRVKYIFFLKKGEEHYMRLEVKRGFAVNEVISMLVEPDVGRAEIISTTYAGD